MPVKPFFSTANAKEMSAKAHEAKRQRKLAVLAVVSGEVPPVQPQAIPNKSSPNLIVTRGNQISALIDMTIHKYTVSRQARDMQSLAMALDRLLGSWSLLTGHPRPGVRRVTKDSNRAPGPAFSPQDHEDPPTPEPL